MIVFAEACCWPGTITVTTDVLTLSIDTVGGDVVHANLNEYSAELDSSDSYHERERGL